MFVRWTYLSLLALLELLLVRITDAVVTGTTLMIESVNAATNTIRRLFYHNITTFGGVTSSGES